MTFYIIMPQLTNAFRASGNMTLMVGYMMSITFVSLVVCKVVVTRYHKEKLGKLLNAVMADWRITKNNGERNTMLQMMKYGRNLSFRCYAMSIGTIIFYSSVHIFTFFRNRHSSQKRLLYHFKYLYNTYKSPNYEITYAIQLIGGVFAAIVNATVDSFVSILLLHICAQLTNLRTRLNDLVDQLAKRSISTSKFKKDLATVVKRHQKLIRNIKTIDDCYSAVLLVHMLATTFQMCFQTFQSYTMIADKQIFILKLIFLTFYLGIMLLNFYIYCYAAEILVTESTGIAYSVYECKWYDIPVKDVKSLMFILQRSIIPLRLTAGKFGYFSIEMFGAVLKTSLGYLSVLLTMRD